ncbi:hypothetical protein [Nocardia sp. NPDC004260]
MNDLLAHFHRLDQNEPPTVPLHTAKHRRPPKRRARRVPLRTSFDDRDPLTLIDELVLLGCGVLFGGFFGTLFGLAWGGVW